MSCDFFELTNERGGKSYRRIPVRRGGLILADRGHSNAAGVRTVLAGHGDMLVRWNSFSFPLEMEAWKPFMALHAMSKLPKRGARDWPVWLTYRGKRSAGRLCAIRESADAAVRAQEKMRRQARKKQDQVDGEALKVAEFIMVFTTVTRITLGGDDMHMFAPGDGPTIVERSLGDRRRGMVGRGRQLRSIT